MTWILFYPANMDRNKSLPHYSFFHRVPLGPPKIKSVEKMDPMLAVLNSCDLTIRLPSNVILCSLFRNKEIWRDYQHEDTLRASYLVVDACNKRTVIQVYWNLFYSSFEFFCAF
jgi:hypothetical protein